MHYNLLTKIIKLWTLLGFIFLIIISLLSLLNSLSYFSNDQLILFKYINFNIFGYEDLVRLFISCSALMFIPFCHINKGHINITFMSSFFRNRTILILNRVINILCFFIYCFLCYWMIHGLFEVYSDNVISRVVNLKEWPFFIPGIISLFLCSLISLFNIFGIE